MGGGMMRVGHDGGKKIRRGKSSLSKIIKNV